MITGTRHPNLHAITTAPSRTSITSAVAQDLMSKGATPAHALAVAHAIHTGDPINLTDAEYATFCQAMDAGAYHGLPAGLDW